MKLFTNADRSRLLRAAQDARATKEEKNFLGTMASLAAANVSVSDHDYIRASELAAINMHVEDSVFDREK